MKNLAFFLTFSFIVFCVMNIWGQTVTDVEGNVYNTVNIGTQKWTKENLKTKKYNDKTNIPLITDGIAWNNSSTPAYCWYNNDSVTFGNTYGALYNWHTVNTGKLCPAGWHVPTDVDWTKLNDYLGGASVAGGKLKANTLWKSPNTGATNESGFTALPGGYRGGNGIFEDIGNMGMWWSASGTGFPFDSWLRGLNYNNGNFDRGTLAKYYGFSVRCVNDNIVGIEDTYLHEFKFRLYPNPSQKKVLIECEHSKEFFLQVVDILGKTIIEKQIIEKSEIEIEVKGIYFVRISNTSQSAVKKLIIN